MNESDAPKPEKFNEQLNFSSVIASSVHDMKNSISMLMNSIDELVDELGDPSPKQNRLISILQYETSRVNNDLMHLLSFYRLEQDNLRLSLDEHCVAEVLEDQIAHNKMLAEKKGILLELDCDDSLMWYFDSEMVSGVINNVVINAIRYSRERILIYVDMKDGCLCINVADDGDGFPVPMLKKPGSYFNSVNYSTGSTGLGLYFANQIASLHRHGNNEGYIKLRNGEPLGGGVFTLSLP